MSRREHEEIALAPGQPGYPPLLAAIPDPPPRLRLRGALAGRLAAGGSLPPAIGIVGARDATAYGLGIARELGRGLGERGIAVVSGLALGIDAAAHRGALEAGGTTVAVVGCGTDVVYPRGNAGLREEILARGLVAGELGPGAPPLPRHFPARNRILSGLSLGVVVVEAAPRSGSLVTARHALEQGREVFAVPGQIDCRTARGCHKLIRDGVTLVESVDDILEELGPLFEAATTADGREVRSPAELTLGDIEQQVLTAIDEQGEKATAGIDDLVDASGLSASQVLSTIGVLEMRRIVRRLPGNRVERT